MKVLVDTSAWIDHFRSTDPVINQCIVDGSICCHEFIIAELALGSIPKRSELLSDLASLVQIQRQSTQSLLRFIDKHELASTGLGLVDAQLLTAAVHSGAQIWTKDKRLKAQAEKIACAFKPV